MSAQPMQQTDDGKLCPHCNYCDGTKPYCPFNKKPDAIQVDDWGEPRRDRSAAAIVRGPGVPPSGPRG
ncbi:hypothetical protein [Streptomyces sp. NPDC056061]|uniref:hypothetical protein n=1 Tax=Streptomyces sp. NPDC056061 TaxID=3345700 RepID=UPI0035D7FB0F